MAWPTSRDVLLQTPDIAAAAVYYEQLGFVPFMNEPTIIGLDAGAFRLFIEAAPTYGPVFEVFVDDLAEAKARLTALGGTIDDDDPSVPRCHITDRFGLSYNLAVR